MTRAELIGVTVMLASGDVEPHTVCAIASVVHRA